MMVTAVKTISDAANDAILRAAEAEQLLIAAGWISPVAMHDAAFRRNLCGDCFADRRLGFVHAYLASVAEHGVTPDVIDCLALSERHGGVPLFAVDCDWLDTLIFTSDARVDRIDEYARTVRELFDDRERVILGGLRQLAALAYPESQFEFVVRRRTTGRRNGANQPRRRRAIAVYA